MKLILAILLIFLLASGAKQVPYNHENEKIVPLADSLLSIADFGANPSNPDNSEAFRIAFEKADHIYIPGADSAYIIDGNLMIQKGKSITFGKGAVLDVRGLLSGYDTRIVAANHQIFTKQSQIRGTFVTDTLFADWMGAKGDGINDDYEPLKKFFDLADITEFKYLQMGPNKKYYISSSIEREVNKSFILDGNGSEIIRNYQDISDANNKSLMFSGKKNLSKALSRDLKAGTDFMILDNIIGLDEGMGVVIFSKELFGSEPMADNPDGTEKWHRHFKGLMSRIVKIGKSGQVRLADTIPFDFDAEQIKSVDFYQIIPITVKNLSFSMENVGGTIKAYQLTFRNLFNLNVSDCRFVPNGYTAITVKAIYNSQIKNIYIEAPKEGNNTILGVYGIVPSLNVNVVYDSIYARAMTHGIAFTGEPSYGVEVRNSNLKSVIHESNGFDSHASWEVKVMDSEIWGAQGNWGTYEFVHCIMHNTVEDNNIWSERARGGDGLIHLIIKDCEIRISNPALTNLMYMAPIKDSSNVYEIQNCKFFLADDVNSNVYLLNAPKILDSTAKIKWVKVENCSFYGSSKMFLPRNKKGVPACLNKGTFIFRNNTYSNLQLINPNVGIFGDWIIEGNRPAGNESNFAISIQNTEANFKLTENQLTGQAFIIKNNTGSFQFNNNQIYSGVSVSDINVFSNNQNSVFKNNTYKSASKLEITGAER